MVQLALAVAGPPSGLPGSGLRCPSWRRRVAPLRVPGRLERTGLANYEPQPQERQVQEPQERQVQEPQVRVLG